MRHPLALGALATLPLALAAAAACSPVDRILPSGTGASTSAAGTGGSSTSSHMTSTGSKTSTGTKTSSSTTGTGGTGTGGSAPMGKCTANGAVFTVISSTALAGAQLDDKPVVVADPGTMRPMAHVVVNAKSSGAVFIRSLTNDPTNTVANLVTYTGPPTAVTSYEAVGGWVAAGGGVNLYVQGFSSASQSIGQLAFPLDPNAGVLAGPTETDYNTPADCQYPNNPGRAFVVQDPNTGSAHYFTSCNINSSPPTASTWIGNDDPAYMPVEVATGMGGDMDMNPGAYSYANGVGIVSYDGKSVGGSPIAFGPDNGFGQPATLAPLASGQDSLLLTAVPTAAGDGFITFVGSLAQDLSSGSLWNGSVTFADLPMLAASPTKVVKQFTSGTSIADLGAFVNAAVDANFIYGAGPTFTNDAVTFEWFERDGTPLVVEQKVYSTSNYTVIAAGAAPLGAPKVVVVWVEHDGASPPNYQVRAQLLDCIKG